MSVSSKNAPYTASPDSGKCNLPVDLPAGCIPYTEVRKYHTEAMLDRQSIRRLMGELQIGFLTLPFFYNVV